VHLYDIPMACVLIGLILYAILGGADFGAGLWQLTALPPLATYDADSAKRIREHAHHSMGPVWEANHVWLIFVLTVTWTAFPTAFGAIASTLAVPLTMVGVGISFRGAAYAFRTIPLSDAQLAYVDTVFSLSSIIIPFGLGAAIGAIAGGRVPVGNAAGSLFSSWLNPVSIIVGLLAVSVSAYTAAVYLAADAERHHDPWMVSQFRSRALQAGLVSGLIALVGIPVMHSDAHRVFERLITGPGIVGLVISVVAGVATLTLVVRRRWTPARISAALAVAGIIIGWALAQQPIFLPGLTIAQAAAPNQTQILVTVAIAIGAVTLLPSLWFLFGLVLGGRFDERLPDAPRRHGSVEIISASTRGLLGRASIACLIAGVGLLNAANANWCHIIGVLAFVACIVLGVLAVAPTQLAARSPDDTRSAPD
jgi:cytochrome bd ubiquinol oxidase subunit II